MCCHFMAFLKEDVDITYFHFVKTEDIMGLVTNVEKGLGAPIRCIDIGLDDQWRRQAPSRLGRGLGRGLQTLPGL